MLYPATLGGLLESSQDLDTILGEVRALATADNGAVDGHVDGAVGGGGVLDIELEVVERGLGDRDVAWGC